jgi:tRNA threonylcarbamoyl adenosine modification protein (Sua5/YciO/YrdC/YwlC family)
MIKNIASVKEHILNHGIVAFKTDTVMGLGVNALDRLAVENLFKIKNRPFKKPLYLLCYSFTQIFEYTHSIPDYAYDLMNKHFPGAITFIYYSTGKIWTMPLERGKTIGVRIPNLNPLLELLAVIDLPIVNTSANISGEKHLYKKEELEKFFGKDVLYIPFEYNISMTSVPSTIVDCTGDIPIILRKGAMEI